MPPHAASPSGCVVLSVIIPTLNEARTLPQTLDALAVATNGGFAYETIVVDGGSTDETLREACARNCECVLSARAQRAAQMNAGAARARGTVLLFLHADTRLPPGAADQVASACAQPGVVGGGFARRYDLPSRWLRVTCWLAEQRNRWFGWHLGDQAIFVRRSVFEQLGGFRELGSFEDVDFSHRLRRAGKVVTLQPPVISSARRFSRRGPLLTSLVDIALTLRYLASAAGRVRR